MPHTLAMRAVLEPPLPILAAADAALCGIRVDRRSHHRVRPGCWVDRATFRTLSPWERYAVRVHAFARAHPDAVLAYESAAVLHGLPLFGEPVDVHVLAVLGARSRRRGDVCAHATAVPPEVIRVGGILVTSLLDTVVALARVLPLAQALAVTDAATSRAQGGPLDVAAMAGRLADESTSRGRRRCGWVLSRTDGRSESPGESVSRAVIEWSGFETPLLQHPFTYDGHDDRVDFFFPASGSIGEADGWGKYGLEEPGRAAEALRSEKLREDRLRRHGHLFARWDLRGALEATPLQQALTAARVRRMRPANPTLLATLRESPRTVAR